MFLGEEAFFSSGSSLVFDRLGRRREGSNLKTSTQKSTPFALKIALGAGKASAIFPFSLLGGDTDRHLQPRRRPGRKMKKFPLPIRRGERGDLTLERIRMIDAGGC